MTKRPKGPGKPNPRWPDEPFRAKHDASGSPVTIIPIDLTSEEGGEHWTDANQRKVEEIKAALGIETISVQDFAALVTTPSFLLDVAIALAARVKALEERMKKLEGKRG